MKNLIILGIFLSILFGLGFNPMVEAHPHATTDLMESHSHDIHSENFEKNFTLHSFEHVIIFTYDWFKSILFG